MLGALDYNAASTPIILEAFVAFRDSSFQAVGLAGMLSTNQAGTLNLLSRLWPLLSNEPYRDIVVFALRDEWRDMTPAGVDQLSAIVEAASTSSDLRAAAIRSLIATHTAESLPLFGRLLFGSDSDEQMEAAIAISAFVNGCGAPTPATVASLAHLDFSGTSAYKSNETIAQQVIGLASGSDRASAVAFWQGWWSSHPGAREGINAVAKKRSHLNWPPYFKCR